MRISLGVDVGSLTSTTTVNGHSQDVTVKPILVTGQLEYPRDAWTFSLGGAFQLTDVGIDYPSGQNPRYASARAAAYHLLPVLDGALSLGASLDYQTQIGVDGAGFKDLFGAWLLLAYREPLSERIRLESEAAFGTVNLAGSSGFNTGWALRLRVHFFLPAVDRAANAGGEYQAIYLHPSGFQGAIHLWRIGVGVDL